MELCERYLHYMSALCEGTMPAPPELALTADTTEERAAQLQSALKSMSVPDFVRLCAKSAGDELDEAIRFVRERPRPLALYVFSEDAAAVRRDRSSPRKSRPQQKVPLIPTRASTRSRSSATAWSSTSSSSRTSSTF